MRFAIETLGLVFVLGLSACAGGEGDNLEQFVGRWQAMAGETKTVCPGGGAREDAPAGDVVWIYGIGSDLVSSTPLTSCRIKADVDGATASIVAGHRCKRVDEHGGTATVTFDNYEFWISHDGQIAFENASGQVTTVHRGEAKACSFRGSSWYRKVDVDATPGDPVR